MRLMYCFLANSLNSPHKLQTILLKFCKRFCTHKRYCSCHTSVIDYKCVLFNKSTTLEL